MSGGRKRDGSYKKTEYLFGYPVLGMRDEYLLCVWSASDDSTAPTCQADSFTCTWIQCNLKLHQKRNAFGHLGAPLGLPKFGLQHLVYSIYLKVF